MKVSKFPAGFGGFGDGVGVFEFGKLRVDFSFTDEKLAVLGLMNEMVFKAREFNRPLLFSMNSPDSSSEVVIDAKGRAFPVDDELNYVIDETAEPIKGPCIECGAENVIGSQGCVNCGVVRPFKVNWLLPNKLSVDTKNTVEAAPPEITKDENPAPLTASTSEQNLSSGAGDLTTDPLLEVNSLLAPTPINISPAPVSASLSAASGSVGENVSRVADMDRVSEPATKTGGIVGGLPVRVPVVSGVGFRSDAVARGIGLGRIMVANTKGGAGKTPLAVLLAQCLARRSGRNDVSIVEVNPRGTLAARTVCNPSTKDVVALARLLAKRGIDEYGSISDFICLNAGGFGVLPCPVSVCSESDTASSAVSVFTSVESNNVLGESPAHNDVVLSPLDAEGLQLVSDALAKTQRVIIFDTGNNDADPAWQQAARLADRLVVPVQWDPDSLRMCQQMLQDLITAGHEALVRGAVIVGTYPRHAKPRRRDKQRWITEWQRGGFKVCSINSDKHLDQQDVIEWEKLANRTRRDVENLVDTLAL